MTIKVDSVEEVIEGAYIENVECGYLSFEPKPENGIVYLISDEADIEIAETRLGMKIPDDAMDGEFKIAAIPKDIFITRTFRFVVRPSEMEFEN